MPTERLMTTSSGRCSTRPSFHLITRASLTLLILTLPGLAQTPPNYDDDIKPLIQRRCLPCHSSSEMRASLNLETFQGVMKGGGSGDVVKPGRVSASMLYKVLAREEGVPQMPLGGPKLPDADINKVREWIQGGLLENANSKPQGPAVQSLDFKPTGLNKPAEPAMPDRKSTRLNSSHLGISY